MINNIFNPIPIEPEYSRRTPARAGRGGAPGLGGTPIIMTFVILCLTVFAALTLSTASSEYNLSSKYAEAVRAYYAADAEGARFVAALRLAANGAKTAQNYADSAVALGAEVAAVDSAATITRDIAIDGGQTLRITLTADESGLHITSWRIVYTGEWSPVNNFNLWTG